MLVPLDEQFVSPQDAFCSAASFVSRKARSGSKKIAGHPVYCTELSNQGAAPKQMGDNTRGKSVVEWNHQPIIKL